MKPSKVNPGTFEAPPDGGFDASRYARPTCTRNACTQSPGMRPSSRQRLRLSGGTELSFITAGEPSRPAVLLMHGTPNSARMFREVMPELSQVAYVIAPESTRLR